MCTSHGDAAWQRVRVGGGGGGGIATIGLDLSGTPTWTEICPVTNRTWPAHLDATGQFYSKKVASTCLLLSYVGSQKQCLMIALPRR